MNMQDYNRVYQRVHIRSACREDILRDGASGTPRRITHRRASIWDYAPALTGLAACLMLLICGGIILSGLREGGLQGPTSSETEITSDTAMPYTDTTTAQTQTTARTVSQPESTSGTETADMTETALPADTTLPTAETTQTTSETDTTAAASGNALRFEVRVVNDETAELFPNVNVRLEKWYYSLNIPPATSHEDYYTGEIEVMESWNTSDANPYLSGTYEYTPEKPFDVFAVIDKVSAGYSFYGQESGKLGWTTVKAGNETYGCTIRLKKEEYYDYADFPITGTYTRRIRVIDTYTKEPMPDLDCVVINTDTGEEVYRWNTSEEPVAVVSGLEYRFEDWKMTNTVSYIVKILNMPEGYIMNFMGLTDYEPIYYWGAWYDEGLTEIDTDVELYNTASDAYN